MIYLDNISYAQSFFVPKERAANGDLKFTLRSTINQLEIEKDVIDINISSLFFLLSIALGDNVVIGEYEYTLTDAEGVLSSGLLVIEESSAQVQYQKNVQYEQYRGE